MRDFLLVTRPPLSFNLRTGLLLLALCCLLTRNTARFFHPEFWAEDGAVWLEDGYTQGWTSLLHQHTGYLQTFPRLIGFLAAQLNLAWAPTIFIWAGLAVQIAPVALLLSARAQTLIPSLTARLLLIAFYVGVPNSFETYLYLTDAQWHYAIILFLLTLLPAPRTRFGLAVQVLALLVGGLSGPFCILLLPIVWWEVWADRAARRFRLLQAVLFTAASLVQIGFMLSQTHGFREGMTLGANFSVLSTLLTRQIFLGGVVGADGTGVFSEMLASTPRHVSEIYAVLSLLVLLAALMRGPGVFRKFVLFAVLILTAALLSPVGAIGVSVGQWVGLEVPGAGSRYYLLPILAWFGAFLVLASPNNPRVVRWPARLLMAAFLIGIVSDWHYVNEGPSPYQKVVARFAAAKSGTTMIFPETPYPSNWIFALTKH